MTKQIIGVIGATSLVGDYLLTANWEQEVSFVAFSRRKIKADNEISTSVIWKSFERDEYETLVIKDWICLAPIKVLPDYFSMLEKYGAQRIVALSSTSRFTKTTSSDTGEKQMAAQLIEAEQQLQHWAEQHKVEWIVLRPTLIYGLGRDKNVSTIISFVKRFGFFPLFGAAKGKRQPIRLEDVAKACILALNARNIANQAYNITGAETLTYDEMVKRIFQILKKKPYLVHLPLNVFRIAIKILHILPNFRGFTAAMAERMNQDLVFDCSEARKDFNFQPSAFKLEEQDLDL
jgi:nucleoside-diphosphate-sugar epimerase